MVDLHRALKGPVEINLVVIKHWLFPASFALV